METLMKLSQRWSGYVWLSMYGILIWGIGAGHIHGREMVIVAAGESRVPIIVAADTAPVNQGAAEELADFIAKTTGVRPEVQVGTPDPVPAGAIWVGVQPAVESLFPDIDFDFQNPEEIVIACNGAHLVIAGRDRWNAEFLAGQDLSSVPAMQLQYEYGTANAVYTFIQEMLGVRWFWPGPLGEDILEQDALSFTPFVHRHTPQFRYRGGLMHTPMRIFRMRSRGDNADWIRLQRLAYGSLDMNAAGHGFGTWWDRYHETNPEFFALQPDGTRSGFPNPGTAKMCHSNPAVAEQWIAEVAEQLESNPMRRVFNASPNDSFHRGHCVCADCLAWDHPDGEMLNFVWQGISQHYVALSDRHVKFANRCARLLREKYPDKDYYVALLAYGNWRPAPIEAIPDDNVVIVNVANMFWGVDTREGVPAQQFADWAEVTNQQVWRPNTGDPAGWQKGLPDVPLRRNAEAIKHAAAHGGMGISVDMVWEHWATQGPLYYLGTQLVWDPSGDVDEIMDDYYRRAFGPAAPQLEEYWTLMEEARNRKVDEYPGEANGFDEVYDDAFFARVNALLDAAEAATANAPEKYRQRVDFVRAGLRYTELAAELRQLIERIRITRGGDAEADQRARDIWVEVEQICNDYPYSMRWNRITPGSRRVMRGGGLHPDHLR